MATEKLTQSELLAELTALREHVASLEGELATLRQVQSAEREEHVLAEALNDAANALSSTLELDEVLEHILADVRLVLPHDAAGIRLVEDGHARFAAGISHRQEYVGEETMHTVDPQVEEHATFRVANVSNLRQMEKTGQPLAIPNTKDDPDWVVVPQHAWVRSYAAAPILSGEELIGILSVFSRTPDHYSQADAERLQAFATRAAVAIRNARLYEEVQQAARDQIALNRVVQVASSTLELVALLGGVAQAAAEALGAPRTLIILGNLDSETMHIAGGYDRRSGAESPDVGREISRDAMPHLWESLRTLEPQVLADVQTGVHDEKTLTDLNRLGINSLLAVPIALGEDTLGVLSLGCSNSAQFGEHQVRLAQAIARQAAVAIQNARLYEEVQRHANELDVLRRITLDMTARLDRNAVLHTLVKRSIELLDAQGGAFWLVRPEGDLIQVIITMGLGQASTDMTLRRGEGLVGTIWDTGKPLVLEDYEKWEGALPSFRDVGPISVLGMPVQSGDEFLGVILVTADRRAFFNDRHARLVGLFATQAAIAIRNAQLYQQVQRQAVQLEALRHVTLEITAALDLPDLLEALVENATRLLGVEAGGIYLYRPEREVIEWAVMTGEGYSPPGTFLRRGEGLSGQVWETGEPLWVDHYTEWEGRARIYDTYPMTAVMAVPIRWGDEFLGVFDVMTEAPHRRFNEKDAHLLSLFASQAAIAIKNAKLYEAVRDQADELEETVTVQSAQLARERERAAAILRSVGEPVALVDAEGYILEANPAFERQIGWVSHSGELTHVSEFFAGDDLPDRLVAEARSSLLSEEVWRGEVVFTRRDSTLYEAAATVTPLRSDSGDPEFYVASLRDISARKEIDRLKHQFMRLVRHEMRTPLTSIRGFSSMLLDGEAGPLGETAMEYVRFIKHGALRLSSIVDAILDVMRIYAGEVTLDVRPVALDDVIRRVIDDVRPQAEANRQQIEVNVSKDLPPLAADKWRLMQVLRNLVENAVKYAGEGCRIDVDAWYVQSASEISPQAQGAVRLPSVLVRVVDNGQGIVRADRVRLYEPFVRAGDPSSQSRSGSGLGLYIAHKLAELHGGATWLEGSSPGEGSTFYVAWPVADGGIVPQELQFQYERRTPSLSLLVVTADERFKKEMTPHLQEAGLEVIWAGELETFLDALHVERPNLVVVDVALVNSDGQVMFDRLALANTELGTPVVALRVEETPDGETRYRISDLIEKSLVLEEAVGRIVETVNRTSKRAYQVLVIEDEHEIQELVESVLRDRKMRVRVAASGEQAQKLVKQVRPDLILLGLLLPDVDGYKLLAEFKQDASLGEIPVIVMTANAKNIPDARAKALALGADGFMTKPFVVEHLVDEIELLLDV